MVSVLESKKDDVGADEKWQSGSSRSKCKKGKQRWMKKGVFTSHSKSNQRRVAVHEFVNRFVLNSHV